ncbi:MAG: acetyltransferase, possible [Osedax symbiont Rs2]|nr:MAG: acetyltransferase, possible [Osedax symbiont Rs2]
MQVRIRRADLKDLSYLVTFTAEEAREAEGSIKIPDTLEKGIRKALEDDSVALYWVLVDDQNSPVGSVSAIKEWSDWNAGYYWWIQSMYLSPIQRGKGRMALLLDAVKYEMQQQQGLELRLYVHEDNRAAIRAYEKSEFVHSKYKIMTLSK